MGTIGAGNPRLQEARNAPGITATAPFRFNRHVYEAPEPSVSGRLGLSTRLHRAALDEQIARCVDVKGDERLALRVGQLASVPLRVEEIRDCASDLDALVARLRDEGAVDAQASR